MAKEKQRFEFFKYVPEKKARSIKKDITEQKIEEYTNTEAAANAPLEDQQVPEVQEEVIESSENQVSEEKASEQGWFKNPFPGYPDEPECPDYPEMPDYPELPPCPGEPEYPVQPPEVPAEPPECPVEPPVEGPPEVPECPELPPAPAPSPCPPENSVMHVVQRGDTYWKLAKRYNTTVEAIEAANPGVNPLNLQIGQTICIPLGIPGAKG